MPVLEVEEGDTEGWRGDKRRGCGGALRTAPSVRPAQAASWVSSPSSVHWPLYSQSKCVVNLNTDTHCKFK